MTSSDNLG